MARFRFRLQPALEMRRRAEQDRQRAVAELERERLAVEDALRARQAAIRACKDEMRDALSGGRVDLSRVRMQAGESFHLVALAQRTAVALAGAHQRVEAARRELQEAARARKALETLRERQWEVWRREQERRDAAATDEIVVMRAAGRREDQP